MRLLDRYVAVEFLAPFAVTAAGFMVLLLTSTIFQLADLVVVQRVAALSTVNLLLLKVPAALSLAIPIATLFATLLATGRLMRDGELTVMRTAGLSLLRIGTPMLVLGGLISAANYALNEYVLPAANYRYEVLVRRLMSQDPVPAIAQDVFFRGGPSHWFYVREVNRDQRLLKDVLVYELVPGSFPTLYTARRGYYQGRTWVLEDVTMKRLDEQGYVAVEAAMRRWQVTLAEPTESLLGAQKSPDAMSRRELGEQIRRMRQAGLAPGSLLVDYHVKLSLPLSCLVLVLLGLPLALQGGRGDRSFGVAASLGLTLLYYILFALSRSLGNSGSLSPVAAAWLPNLTYLAAAGWLLHRAEWAG